MQRTSFAILASFAVAAACSKSDSAAADSTKRADSTAAAAAAAPAAVTKAGEAAGMSTPESVRYDADRDVFFVSNINGNPSVHDGNGFIAVIAGGGVVTHLADGGKNGVTLDAPKGMAIVGDTLWVADIDAVRGFNRKTGAPVASISLKSQKATFLNDVAVGPDGAIYITDTGIVFDAKGAITHPGVNRIFKIAGRTVSEVASGDSLGNPNGLAWDTGNARWVLAPFGSNDVQTLKPGDKVPTKLATGPGQYDGVEVLSDGRILVSSWADSAVHVIRNGTMSKLVANVSAPADFGIDTKRMVLAVPRFNDNKVEFYKIP